LTLWQHDEETRQMSEKRDHARDIVMSTQDHTRPDWR